MTHGDTSIQSRLGRAIGLLVDVAWSFRSAVDMIAAIRTWEEADLAWMEDPFPTDGWRSTIRRGSAGDR